MLRIQISALAIAAVAVLAPATARAQVACAAPNNSCSLGPDVTFTSVDIGGPGSIGSRNMSPARCDDGTPVRAHLDITFRRSTAQLTVVAANTTASPNVSSLTGFAFNVPSAIVSSVSLVSVTGSSLTWSGAFDRSRSGDGLDVPPVNLPGNILAPGFGKLNVFAGDAGINTGVGAGNPAEILPGGSVTFVFSVSGNLAAVTACSFTSVATLIAPGDKTALAAARFQACNQGGTTWAGPCTPIDLRVDLIGDLRVTAVDDGRVELAWETGSEVDNAGFAILEQGVRDGGYRRLGAGLIPARGTPSAGATYVFDHTTAINGRKILLRLEDWDTSGNNTIRSAVEAIPNPSHPPIRTVAPAYDEQVPRRGPVKLVWQAARASWRRSLQLSADPSFPIKATLDIPVGTVLSRVLSKRERAMVEDMAGFGSGGIYWRVKGADAVGRQLLSDVSFFTLSE